MVMFEMYFLCRRISHFLDNLRHFIKFVNICTETHSYVEIQCFVKRDIYLTPFSWKGIVSDAVSWIKELSGSFCVLSLLVFLTNVAQSLSEKVFNYIASPT